MPALRSLPMPPCRVPAPGSAARQDGTRAHRCTGRAADTMPLPVVAAWQAAEDANSGPVDPTKFVAKKSKAAAKKGVGNSQVGGRCCCRCPSLPVGLPMRITEQQQQLPSSCTCAAACWASSCGATLGTHCGTAVVGR